MLTIIRDITHITHLSKLVFLSADKLEYTWQKHECICGNDVFLMSSMQVFAELEMPLLPLQQVIQKPPTPEVQIMRNKQDPL